MGRLLAVAALVSLLAGTGTAAAEVPISAEARSRFAAGVALLDDPDGPRWEEAYRAFKSAYDASPSPKILGNIGLCAMKLERDGEAIEAFRRYLEEVDDIPAREKRQVERDLTTLSTSIVEVNLHLSPGAATVVDERRPVQGPPIVNRYPATTGHLQLGLHPGSHHLTIEAPDHEPETLDLELQAGGRVDRTVALRPISTANTEPADESFPIPLVVAASITGAAGLAALVTGPLALERKSAFEEANDGSDPAAAEAIRATGRRLNVATDVLLGVTVAGAAVTTVLLVLELTGDDPGEADVAVSLGPTSLALSGRF
ncbi:MAG: hypothetical protein KC731_29065 [Myxococcales bacterium]|nr:hypothetical protein [Myxococcales bacterium]